MNITITRPAGEIAVFYKKLTVHYEWKRRRECCYYDMGFGDVFADYAEAAEHERNYYAGCVLRAQAAVSSGNSGSHESMSYESGAGKMTAQIPLKDHPVFMAVLELGWTVEDYLDGCFLNGWNFRRPGRGKKSQVDKRKSAIQCRMSA